MSKAVESVAKLRGGRIISDCVNTVIDEINEGATMYILRK